MKAISIQQLHKTYDNGFTALNSINLDVESGDFFALLGPNGAGKSTLIGIVSSLVNKSSGQISVFGHDLDRSCEAVKKCIGLVPQEFNFNVFEPVNEILMNSAGYHGIKRPLGKARAEEYLKRLDLWDKRHAIPQQLSGGMKRRLMIARALVHEPRLLILDEPTAGVDIEIRRTMWQFLNEINEQYGTTIILTTHYLEEAESLCRNVAIIDGGNILEHGAVSTLLSQSMLETFVLDLAQPMSDAIHDTPPNSRSTTEINGFQTRCINPTRIEAEVPRGTSLTQLFGALGEAGIEVASMRNKSNRLEEFFLRLLNQNKNKNKNAESPSEADTND